MVLDGNPKKIALDIADGYVQVTRPYCKRLGPGDFKILCANLSQLQKDLRTEVIPPEEAQALQKKNRRMQKISQAMMLIRAYAKEKKYPV